MSYEAVLEAKERISPYIHHTPVMTCSTLDELVGREIYLKCENFQKTGSFKARGALNAVLSLKEAGNQNGVVTHSSGNHGQALAWAASMVGVPCAVVVPNGTSPAKCDAITRRGATLRFTENTFEARMSEVSTFTKEKSMTYVSTFDNMDVIHGQGTMAVELLQDVPDLDAIVVPISGGGMVAGIALAAKHIKPDVRVFAAEAKGKDLERSLKAGEKLWPLPARYIDTVADAIRFQAVGELAFPILCQHAEKQVFSVSDDEMIKAMKLIFERAKLVIEVSSAAGVAAVMSQRMREMDPSLRKIGVILCGGNADLDRLPWCEERRDDGRAS